MDGDLELGTPNKETDDNALLCDNVGAHSNNIKHVARLDKIDSSRELHQCSVCGEVWRPSAAQPAYMCSHGKHERADERSFHENTLIDSGILQLLDYIKLCVPNFGIST